MELYIDGKKDLHTVFIDLEKAYDRVSLKVLCECWEKKEALVAYIRVLKDKGVRTSVRISGADTKTSLLKVGCIKVWL